MPDDMSFLDADKFPDRPDTPDFWRLSKIVLANDAAAQEDHKPIPEIIGEFCDYPSLEYFVMSRMGQLITQMGLPPALIPVLASTWFDAFTTGIQFANEKQREFFVELASKMTPPEEVFGPVDLDKLAAERMNAEMQDVMQDVFERMPKVGDRTDGISGEVRYHTEGEDGEAIQVVASDEGIIIDWFDAEGVECVSTFAISYDDLIEHFDSLHGLFRCLSCGKQFVGTEAMNEHINTEHPEGYGE